MSVEYPVAVMRDAQHYNRPDCHKTKKYHVMQSESWVMACGMKIVPNDDAFEQIKNVPSYQQCQRSGCKQFWPKEQAP